MPFWWGGKGSQGFMWRTLVVRSFLGITEPSFRAFKSTKSSSRSPEEQFFGFWDKEHRSLVLAKDDWLIAYGNESAKELLLQRLHQWVELGMPSAASFRLQVYPIDAEVAPRAHQWIVRRRESQFVWRLESVTPAHTGPPR